MALSPLQQQGPYEHRSNFHILEERIPSYNALTPCPELNFHFRGESNEEAEKQDSAQTLHPMSCVLGNAHLQSAHDQCGGASVVVKANNMEQSLIMKKIKLDNLNNSSGEATVDSKKEYSLSAKSEKAGGDKTSPKKDGDVGISSPR